MFPITMHTCRICAFVISTHVTQATLTFIFIENDVYELLNLYNII